MNLIDYIKGNRKGKQANQIEREALKDAFLNDALEGYESVRGDHLQNIARLQKQIQVRSGSSSGIHPLWKVAAAVVLIVFGLGGYLFVDEQRSQLVAQETALPAMFINIYVPDAFYEEHTEIIAEKNAAEKNLLRAYIEPFRIEENITSEISQEDIDMLTDQKKSVLTIYIPDMVYERHKADIVKENFTTELIASPEDSTAAITIYVPHKDFDRHNK